MALSKRTALQSTPQSRREFAKQFVILSVWLAVLTVSWGQSTVLYLIPVLTLCTWLFVPDIPPLAMILTTLALSFFVDASGDSFSGDNIQIFVKIIIIGMNWAALGLAWVIQSSRQRHDIQNATGNGANRETPEGSRLEPSLAASRRHDLLTPANLIVGFCDILLSPANPARAPLPESHREPVEAIKRNATQLQNLIDEFFPGKSGSKAQNTTPVAAPITVPVPIATVTSIKKSFIVLDAGGTAIDSLKRAETRYNLIGVSSVEAIKALGQTVNVAAVLVNSDDSFDVPLLADRLDKHVPIAVFSLPFSLSGSTQAESRPGHHDYLMKPVQFETLSAAFNRLGIVPRKVLIVDDNADSASMIAHMLQALVPPPQTWTAYSGREALALLQELQGQQGEQVTPDVILLDFVLPDMNGLMLIEFLRSETGLAHIPILLISAHRPEDILEPSRITRLTLYRMAGIPVAALMRATEALAEA